MNIDFDDRDLEKIAEKVAAILLPKLRAERRNNVTAVFWTVEELAAILKVGKSWVYRQTQLGEIPHTKPGKYVLFRPADIHAWLADKTVLPPGRNN